MNKMILSICIATYNRETYLKELVESILTMKRTDFEVVVTDNCSTDNTVKMLEKIQDSRLRICKNKKPIQPSLNMIESIFNAAGKYAFYINDRDFVYPEKMEQVIKVLYMDEFSFVQTTMQKKRNSGELQIYKKGYDSLMHQDVTHHPTGMIYNCRLIHQYCKKDDYYKYIKAQCTFSFLMRDLLRFEKSAIYDIGCWGPPNKSFFKNNRSGTGDPPYFYPEIRLEVMKIALLHVAEGNKFNLTLKQEVDVERYILLFFTDLLLNYKLKLSDPYETAHYGIERRVISTTEMLHVVSWFHKQSLIFLKENDFPSQLLLLWKKERIPLILKTLRKSIITDVILLKNQ